ncbi:hypothetical protein QZH41_008112 [Actinostola sp. cb2023]|nr:hypothetical protein QZH41_008112 [Actinostola sp. cb2023]
MVYQRTFALMRWVFKGHVRLKSTKTNDSVSRVFLFPGQSSQFVGMCERYKNESWLESLFDRASSCVGFDLLKLCLKGPKEELQRTEKCQLAVVIASLAAVEWCRYHGDLAQHDHYLTECNVSAVAGFSVGEFAALVFAKALSMEDALKVVQCRAQAMQIASEEHPSGMVTVKGLNEDEIHKLCETAVVQSQATSVAMVANYLYPRGHVIAGTMDAVEYVLQCAKSKHGAKDVKQLPVSGAFHTPLMSSAQPAVKQALDGIDISLPQVPVYSNVTGKPFETIEQMKTLLVEQVVQPVQWHSLVHTLIRDKNPDRFYEVGPGRQLNAMLCQIDSRYKRHCKNIPV